MLLPIRQRVTGVLNMRRIATHPHRASNRVLITIPIGEAAAGAISPNQFTAAAFGQRERVQHKYPKRAANSSGSASFSEALPANVLVFSRRLVVGRQCERETVFGDGDAVVCVMRGVVVVVMHVVAVVEMRDLMVAVEVVSVRAEVVTVGVEVMTRRLMTRRRETVVRGATRGGVRHAAVMCVAGRDVTGAGRVVLLTRHEHGVQQAVGIRKVQPRDVARVETGRQRERAAFVIRRGDREVAVVANIGVVMRAVAEEQDYVARQHACADDVVRDIAHGKHIRPRTVDGVQVERVADADRVVVVVGVDVAVFVDGHADNLADAFTERDIEVFRMAQVRRGFTVAQRDHAIGPPEVAGIGNVYAQAHQVLRRLTGRHMDRSLIAAIGKVGLRVETGSNHGLGVRGGCRKRERDGRQNYQDAARAFLNLGQLVVGGG